LARAWLEHAPKPAGLETVGVRIERDEADDQ
jgi:hypothetical protein